MNIENEYLEDEVRDGFYIPSAVKRAWAAEMEVLSEVDRICRKHKIRYFADWGTLLATVRHEGYIPWDDDLDIVMKRADYERFMEIAQTELPEGFSAYNYRNHDDFWLFLARVVGKQRICFEEDHLKRFHEFPYIAGVDIFVLDYVSRDPQQEEERDRLAMYTLALADGIAEGKYSDAVKEAALRKVETESGIRIPRNLTGDALRRELYGVVEQLFQRFSEEESDELTQLFPFGMKNKSFRFPKEYYARTGYLPYEQMEMPVPVSYDTVLRRRYGDYMRLVRDAGGHDYPFFASQQRQLEDVLGEKLPHYEFSEGELYRDEEEADRIKSSSFQTMARECVAELERYTEMITAAVGGESMDLESLRALLQESQQLAVDLGTLIEQVKGEGTETVSLLERYCEEVFQIYNCCGSDCESAPENCAELSGRTTSLFATMREIRSCIEREIFARKEAVFLPYKASAWAGLESVWKEACADPQCDVYVIPIPYYYKNYAGDLVSMRYEADKFPEEVSVTRYDKFDFALHRPDMIFIQNPYDQWDPVTSVHTFFYSGNLRKYTDQLIYIPPFVLEEFSKDNFREYSNMQYYCTVPGVVHADRTIVQSENMRRLYIEKLTEFAGEKTRSIWEQKIVGSGSPVMDHAAENAKEMQTKHLPDNWKSIIRKPDGTCKKIIVYGQNASGLVEHKEQALRKQQYVFNIFYESREEVALIYCPHRKLQEFTEPAEPQLWQQYQQIVEGYRRDGWGIYCECDSRSEQTESMTHIATAQQLAAAADAFYGDAGRLALEFQQTGKPVMIQDVTIITE
jgi:phosphorylcholine metabolism protein LicD